MPAPNPASILIREPQLALPGRKPTGPVRIDWSHPLAADLFFACMWGDSLETSHVLFSAIGAPVFDGSSRYVGAEQNGKCLKSTSADWTSGGSLTFPTDWFSGLTVFGCQTSSSFALCGSQGNAQIDVSVLSSGGNLLFRIYNGVLVTSSAFATTGEYVTGAAAYRVVRAAQAGSDSQLFFNGKPYIVDAATGNLSVTNNIVSTIGNFTSAGLLAGGASWFVFSAMWSSRKRKADLQSLSVDPYQFLVPA